MTAPSVPRRGRDWLVVAGLLIVGAVLRLAAARQDLFGDELATYWIATTRSASGVVHLVASTAEITPPLSFLLSWLALKLGHDPELVRLPALIAGIASIPLVYAVGVRTVGRGAALLAAALTTFSPFMIYYSQEARGYGVLMALLLASTLSLLVAVESDRRPWWVLFALFTCLAAYTHYTAVFVLAGQAGWAAWRYPRSRRALALSLGAAVMVYLPWIPSLRGDLDSPTTAILDFLSPLTRASVRSSVVNWTVGSPVTPLDKAQRAFALPSSFASHLPSPATVILLVASLVIGLIGLWSTRHGLRRWFASQGGHLGLVALLAVLTPLGALLQSLAGDNVFRTRSLAASWPYLALLFAALITVGRPALRMAATGCAVAAFALSSFAVVRDDRFTRPGFEQVARVTEGRPGAVIVDGAALSPGPITNMDLPGVANGAPVFRLNVPDIRERPFKLLDKLPDPAAVAAAAVEQADGAPIVVVASMPATSIVDDFVGRLPDDYELVTTAQVPGILDLQAMVFERRDG